MPNWCANSLKLVANTDEQREILKFIRDNCENQEFGLFDHFIPCPEDLKNSTKGYPADPNEEANKEKHGYPTWYEFNTNEWGTKWDAANICIENFDGDSLIITFDTAWSPPKQFYHKMYANEWELTASFIEAGDDYIGYFKENKYTSEPFNDNNFPEDYCYEHEINRFESYFDSVGISHHPAHTGG